MAEPLHKFITMPHKLGDKTKNWTKNMCYEFGEIETPTVVMSSVAVIVVITVSSC